MKESINANTKGDTDVKSEDTILYRPNFFDAREADVSRPGRKKIEWDDFLLMGESNREEAEYIGPDSEEANKIAERTRHQRIGQKILKLASVDVMGSKAA